MNESSLNKYLAKKRNIISKFIRIVKSVEYHNTNYQHIIAYTTAITFHFVSNAMFHKVISTNLFDIAAI